ncbi:hypothetical protein [Kochikohdavirus PBEF19]|uniref:Uncharacterized protein n=1 Tax=Enterococcus phage PBEF129 TaxID=2696337 RepID=A0A7T3JEM6_9CAUD|nr:hypothetical protein [Enterococcus phage PBEF129]
MLLYTPTCAPSQNLPVDNVALTSTVTTWSRSKYTPSRLTDSPLIDAVTFITVCLISVSSLKIADITRGISPSYPEVNAKMLVVTWSGRPLTGKVTSALPNSSTLLL